MRIILFFLFSFNAFAGTAPDIDWKCSNVVVRDFFDSFEEGLGSIYDISDLNEEIPGPKADQDSTGSSIKISKKTIEIGLGQRSWENSVIEMNVDRTSVDGEDGDIRKITSITFSDEEFKYMWRLYDEKNVGLFYQSKKGRTNWKHVATIDCSGVRDLRDR